MENHGVSMVGFGWTPWLDYVLVILKLIGFTMLPVLLLFFFKCYQLDLQVVQKLPQKNANQVGELTKYSD